jgi:hypothetical protein
MNHESRMRAFALTVLWLLMHHIEDIPPDVIEGISDVQTELRSGDKAALFSAWEKMEEAFKGARGHESHFTAGYVISLSAGKAISSVFRAMAADTRAVQEGQDAEGAKRWSGPFKELTEARATAKEACELAIEAGVPRDSLFQLEALVPGGVIPI